MGRRVEEVVVVVFVGVEREKEEREYVPVCPVKHDH